MAHTPSLPRTRSWGTTDLLMLGAVVIWGLNFTVVKLAIQDFSPMAFNALRFGLATVVMLAILGWRATSSGAREPPGVARADIPAIILLGLLGHTLYQLVFINGLARTTPANSSLLMATSPIWVVIISYLLRIERVNRRMWAGILLSFWRHRRPGGRRRGRIVPGRLRAGRRPDDPGLCDHVGRLDHGQQAVAGALFTAEADRVVDGCRQRAADSRQLAGGAAARTGAR